MRFGQVSPAGAVGAILVHSVRADGIAFKKGRLLTAEDAAALERAGIGLVTTARLEDGDVGEDAAASRIARAAAGPGLDVAAAFTGRVNLFATAPGVCVVDVDRLNRLNLLDESVTVATLPASAPVEAGGMVATIKIIPFAAPEDVVSRAEAIAADGGPLIRVAAFRPLRAALVQTRLAGMKESILDKTVGVTRDRLAAIGSELAGDIRVDHDEAAVAGAVAEAVSSGIDLLLIAGASAITDRRDVLPAGIERAGGEVEHFGMPVDPGNLLLLARAGGIPVLGLPGCARSPKLNGFDWVLQRLAAGIPVTRRDIMTMGAGGLLTEIPTRPLPRASTPVAEPQAPRAPRIAALILAAGQSRRMGALNKMIADVDGKPMVAHVLEAVIASHAGSVTVVTGHDPEAVRAALAGHEIRFVHNPHYAEGLSTSLRAGIAALPDDADGVLVCLGDMPRVGAETLNRLIAAFSPQEGRAICVPTVAGKRGNPVLWDRRFFAEMRDLAGDVGAKHLIGLHADQVCEVTMDGNGVLLDIDTPEALQALNS
ncbi:molybdopterin-binding/glycosyltransferase family 2 protein [Skermanella rosea]|uniref:NTP transferase domain-containing protein n=1 Tax=Skermanella rosea TaxID=1817965 RepID=UPI001934852C|nr:molybdopterin-binding/glycosyltransferase family 2 protein [Skermanella rosea]UEM06398.1 molybdopterin-binding/glycosyltransferase family 2 protein [Skermanella rosea]